MDNFLPGRLSFFSPLSVPLYVRYLKINANVWKVLCLTVTGWKD